MKLASGFPVLIPEDAEDHDLVVANLIGNFEMVAQRDDAAEGSIR